MRWIFAAGFALLASMGSYTPIYPWLVEWVPGYQSLRYPSKWLPIVTLVVSLWSGQGIQFLFSSRTKHLRSIGRAMIGGWLAMFVGAIAICSAAAWIIPHGNGVTDPFWGPFRLNVAQRGIGVSCLHYLSVTTVLLAIYFAKSRWPHGRITTHWRAMILACVAIDLVIAHRALAPRVNRVDERFRLTSTEPIPDTIRWMNWVGRNGALPHWRTESSPDRMLEVEATLRSCWFARWHLEHGQAKFNSLVSIRQTEVSEFWRSTREQTKHLDPSERSLRWDQWHNELGIGGLIERDGDVTVLKRIGDSIAENRDAENGDAENRDEFELNTDRPFVKTRPVYQDGHWTATLLNRSDPNVEMTATNLAVRSDGELGQIVTIPSGNWLVRWKYDPWFHNGARWIAMIGWGLAVVWLFIRRLERRRRSRPVCLS